MMGRNTLQTRQIVGWGLGNHRRIRIGMACVFIGIACLTSSCGGIQSAEQGVDASGFIEATSYSLAMEFGGTVREVPVAEGDVVLADQVLVVLDSTEQESMRIQAQAGVQAARAVLKALRDQPSDEELIIAQAGLDEAQGKVDAAEAELALLIAQYSPFDPPDAELHLAQTAVAIAEAELQLAQAEFDRVQAGASEGEIAVAQAQLAEAEANLALIDLQIERMTLRAPVDGVVGQVLVNVGEIAKAGGPLIQVIDRSDLRLTVYVPETQVARLAVGDSVVVTVDAYPDDSWDGNIARIADQAQFTPSNVQTVEERVKLVFAVEITVEDESGRLKSGMPADVSFVP
ncbi:MAG TPA: HlyD family efflux transporter periplasmic adaptor subunit [Anaerolineae bacterium]|nr:HlyD family efflux transporter periplasmic adaptor subunit [Anaerolineae bacterium]